MTYKYIISIKILSRIQAFKDDHNQGAHLASCKIFKISFLHGLWILKQTMHDPPLLKKRHESPVKRASSSIIPSSSLALDMKGILLLPLLDQ
jgi:hypothetical protein